MRVQRDSTGHRERASIKRRETDPYEGEEVYLTLRFFAQALFLTRNVVDIVDVVSLQERFLAPLKIASYFPPDLSLSSLP